MPGPVHWLPIVIVLGSVGFVALLWLFDAQIAKRYRVFHTKLRCFTKQRLVECDFARDAKTGEFLGVRSCTAFDDPEHVTCEQACRELVKNTKAFAKA